MGARRQQPAPAAPVQAPPARTPDPALLQPLESPYRSDQCGALLQTLLTAVDWQHDYLAYGRRFDVPRVQAWYADAGVHYRYANNLLRHQPWIDPVLAIRRDIEAIAGHPFNAVLLTYYRDGDDHVTWHADDEPELGDAPVIASLSLGTTRRLDYRPKAGGASRHVALHNGDLLLMQPSFQRNWLHRVPAEPAVRARRVNLTFRHVHLTRT